MLEIKDSCNLYKGDCLEVMKDIEDKSVDLCVIDPPYFIKNIKGGGELGKRKFRGEIKEFTDGITNDVLEELCRVMKKINIYIWCNKEQLRQYIDFFEDKGAKTDLLTWNKTNPTPLCNNTYLPTTEYLLFFREKGVRIYGEYNTKKKYYITSVNKSDKDKYKHPTVKPVSILRNVIVNSSKDNDVILDCYMGSGSTGQAVLEVGGGRKFIGIELNDEYFSVAKERIENTYKQL